MISSIRVLLSSLISEIKLNMADSTYKQPTVVKENVVVKINGCHALIDLVIVGIHVDHVAPIILGRPYFRTVKTIINVQQGNIRFDLP